MMFRFLKPFSCKDVPGKREEKISGLCTDKLQDNSENELSTACDGTGSQINSVTEAVTWPGIPRRNSGDPARPDTIMLSQAEIRSNRLERDGKCHIQGLQSCNIPKLDNVNAPSLIHRQHSCEMSNADDGLKGVVVERLIVPTNLPSPDTPITFILSESDKDSGIGPDSIPFSSSLKPLAPDGFDTTDASEISDEESSSNVEVESIDDEPFRSKSPFERKIWNRRNGCFRVRGINGRSEEFGNSLTVSKISKTKNDSLKVAGRGSDKNDLEYSADHDELSEQDYARNKNHAQTTIISSCIDHTIKTGSNISNFADDDFDDEHDKPGPIKTNFNEALSDLKMAIAEMREEVAAMQEEAYETESETDDDFDNGDDSSDNTGLESVDEDWNGSQSMHYEDDHDYATEEELSCEVYLDMNLSNSIYTIESDIDEFDNFSDNEVLESSDNQ